jgi:hypothetical protein
MMMFEKFHSYAFLQILQAEMHNSGKDEQRFMSPITIHEKQWLADALETEQASLFLSKETIQKVKSILKNEISQPTDQTFMVEKGKPIAKPVDSDKLSFWTDLIMKRQAAIGQLFYNGEMREATIFPVKLEYSTKDTEWYITGLEIELERESLLHIPLDGPKSFRIWPISEEQFQTFSTRFYQMREKTRERAVIRLNPKVFGDGHPIEDEKLRILYALANFDKEVSVNEGDDQFYEITIYYYQQDFPQLLSVIQLLGNRIEILGPTSLRQTVKEMAQKAFARYLSE